jgi:hypothetical protein
LAEASKAAIAWKSLSTEPFLEMLREALILIRKVVRAKELCIEAQLRPHDLKNFIRRDSKHPNHQAGLRMVSFAIKWPIPKNSPLSEGEKSRLAYYQKKMTDATVGITFDIDEDYLFKYFETLDLTPDRCRDICEALAGNYYCYRISRHENKVLQSFNVIRPYDPYDKLPRFVNYMRYGAPTYTNVATNELHGHIFPVGDAYILFGIVNDAAQLRGINFAIIPSLALNTETRKFINCMYVSYAYQRQNEPAQYDYGPMLIERTNDEYRDERIGEYSFADLRKNVPNFPEYILKYDMTDFVDSSKLLKLCLSLKLS